jgi:hypothetical protein
MKKVVFLDRDGVINKEVGDYVSNLDSFILNPGLESALSYWAQKGYSFAVITKLMLFYINGLRNEISTYLLSLSVHITIP